MDIDAIIESIMKIEKAPKFPPSMYYTEGTKYFNLCQYHKALEFLDNAVMNDPNNIRYLLKRSKCLIALREYKKAIDDANKVLMLYPESVSATDMKGQAQYLMGDFEGGYLTYLEGQKHRPVNNELRLGKQRCKEALDNSMNPSQAVKLDKKDLTTIVNVEQDDSKFENKLKYRRSARECFGKDKKFMEELMKDKNLTNIHRFCKEAVHYIRDCERFWATVSPLSTRKKVPKIVQRGKPVPEAGVRQFLICKAGIRRAEYELKKGRIDDSISEAEKVLDATEYLPKEKEKEKFRLKCDALHLMSLAYKLVNNQFLSQQYLVKESKIADEFKVKLSQIRAYHHLGENYQLKGNISKTLQCLEKISSVLDSKTIEDFEQDDASAGDITQLEAAQMWVNGVRKSLERNSRCSPISDVMFESSAAVHLYKTDNAIEQKNAQE